MNIAYLENANAHSGVGSRAHEIAERFSGVSLDRIMLDSHTISLNGHVVLEKSPWPGFLGSKSIGWVRLKNQAQKISAGHDIVHATNQTLSFLLPSGAPSVVTVHDLIEYTHPQSVGAGVINRYLLSGISRASHIIAVSEYTKAQLITVFGISSDNITVIPNAVSADFYPLEDSLIHTVREEYGIKADTKVILTVGSDHPRKNIATALRAFAKNSSSDVVFIKAGSPGVAGGKESFLSLAENLGVLDKVMYLGEVSKNRLRELYNLADVFVFPSLHEGFGMPVLEAMACNTPVIASRSESLPEVIGGAGILHEAMDVQGFAKSIVSVLGDSSLSDNLIKLGRERLSHFSWDVSAERELEVYEKILHDMPIV